jgi:bloom syndrome protein
MNELYMENRINRFVIDEVHCISSWGQDFRKDYLSLHILKSRFPKVPLLCLTGTATIKMKNDIVEKLNIKKDVVHFQSSFNRPNLFYEIRNKETPKNKNDDLIQLLLTRFKNKSGIIYCISKKDCEKLSETLGDKHDIKCSFYHAGLTHVKRS